MSLFEVAKDIARKTGRAQDAIAFIEGKATGGDAEANLIVAHWFLYGNDRPRSVEAAFRHLHVAAESGNGQAVRLLANLLKRWRRLRAGFAEGDRVASAGRRKR